MSDFSRTIANTGGGNAESVFFLNREAREGREGRERWEACAPLGRLRRSHCSAFTGRISVYRAHSSAVRGSGVSGYAGFETTS